MFVLACFFCSVKVSQAIRVKLTTLVYKCTRAALQEEEKKTVTHHATTIGKIVKSLFSVTPKGYKICFRLKNAFVYHTT